MGGGGRQPHHPLAHPARILGEWAGGGGTGYGGGGVQAVVDDLRLQLNLPPPAARSRNKFSALLGTRGRRGLLGAYHWLQVAPPVGDAGGEVAGRGAAAADTLLGKPAVAISHRLLLLGVQAGALAVLAAEHPTLRAAVAERGAALAAGVVERTLRALASRPSALTAAHTEQLSGVLEGVEKVLEEVEGHYFAARVSAALQHGTVRGWAAAVGGLEGDLRGVVMLGEVGAQVRATHQTVLSLQQGISELQLRPPAMQPGPHPPKGGEQDLEPYELRYWPPPPPPRGYVEGATTPGRAEHTLLASLSAYRVGGDGEAPRLGVCAIGGAGKSTACSGVAAAAVVRARFTRGTLWVLLGASPPPSIALEVAVVLTYSLCGPAAASRLLRLRARAEGREQATAATGGPDVNLFPQQKSPDVIAAAVNFRNSVSPAVAATLLVVVDDVNVWQCSLLQRLLSLVHPATPVLFTTRSPPVVHAVTSADAVTIDALPVEDALELLAVAAGKAVNQRGDPTPAPEHAEWLRRVVDLTQRNALSLSIVGAMVASRGGAWRAVLQALERRWMHPSFTRPHGEMEPRPSVRATLDASLDLLPEEISRDAAAVLGLLPAGVPVSAAVLTRLWRAQLDSAADGGYPAASSGGVSAADAEIDGVDTLVQALVQVGLLRADADAESGDVSVVAVHPVISEYTCSLLGDGCAAAHQRLVDDYMGGALVDEAGLQGWQVYPYWETPNDGYWWGEVARHVAAARNIPAVLSLLDSRWHAARVREFSWQAYKRDLRVAQTALLAVLKGRDPETRYTRPLLVEVCAQLAETYKLLGGGGLDNVDEAIDMAQQSLSLVSRSDAPLRWGQLQLFWGGQYRGRARTSGGSDVERARAALALALEECTREAAPSDWGTAQEHLALLSLFRPDGDRGAHVEEAISCCHRALEVWTPDAAPQRWATVQYILGIAHLERVVGERGDNGEAAVVHYRRAVDTFSQTADPRVVAGAQSGLGAALAARVEGDRAANKEAALRCLARAATLVSREEEPSAWAQAQLSLGDAHMDRSGGDRAAECHAAMACYYRVAQAVDRRTASAAWAQAHQSMGDSCRPPRRGPSRQPSVRRQVLHPGADCGHTAGRPSAVGDHPMRPGLNLSDHPHRGRGDE